MKIELNRDQIKYIAVFTMLLNHVANIFLQPGTFACEALKDIGYFTAPVMCWFLVEVSDDRRGNNIRSGKEKSGCIGNYSSKQYLCLGNSGSIVYALVLPGRRGSKAPEKGFFYCSTCSGDYGDSRTSGSCRNRSWSRGNDCSTGSGRLCFGIL